MKIFLKWMCRSLFLIGIGKAGLLAAEQGLEGLEEGLDSIVREERGEWGLDGVGVALVDDGEIVVAKGYGGANRHSVFRVGSISKLLNALAVMQQVEAGKLALDAPLSSEFLPLNPFADAPIVTLRQILCHRSGLQREGAVGGYLDPTEPSLADTVASVRSGVSVTEPGKKMRYSNLAPSIAGFLVSQATGLSYPEYQKKKILEPLGMSDSVWRLSEVKEGRLIRSFMRVADGRGGWNRRETPVFDLGTIPAGNLFSTLDDLTRFATALMNGGKGLLSLESLEEMWRPQLTEADRGFGLGFSVGRFGGHRSVSHSGAVYGHSTSFIVLPEARLACIVLVNEDIANGRVRRIAHGALKLLLAERRNEVPENESVTPYQHKDLSIFVGDYESESYWGHLELLDGKLIGNLSGQETRFREKANREFLADSRIMDRGVARFHSDSNGKITGFTLGGQNYQRIPRKARELPSIWQELQGTYGHEFIPIIVSERHGHLYAMTENMVDYRLRPESRQVWSLPPGMYVDEEVVFQIDDMGRAFRMNFANMIFDRVDEGIN